MIVNNNSNNDNTCKQGGHLRPGAVDHDALRAPRHLEQNTERARPREGPYY